MSVRRASLLLAVAVCAALAEDALPEVPDPLGLGRRLALIDLLQQQYGVTPPPESSEADLETIWRAEIAKREQPTADETFAAAAARDRVALMRAELQKTYGVAAPEDADEKALSTMLADARDRAARTAPKPIGSRRLAAVAEPPLARAADGRAYRLDPPPGWAVDASGAKLVLVAPSGTRLLVTAMPETVAEGDDAGLRATTIAALTHYVDDSVEREVRLEALSGAAGAGYHARFTDAQLVGTKPPEGRFVYVDSGLFRIGPHELVFTVLANEPPDLVPGLAAVASLREEARP